LHTRPKPLEYPQWAKQQTAAVLDQLERDGDFATAREKLTDMFDQVITWAPRSKLDSFRDTALALRMVAAARASAGRAASSAAEVPRAKP